MEERDQFSSDYRRAVHCRTKAYQVELTVVLVLGSDFDEIVSVLRVHIFYSFMILHTINVLKDFQYIYIFNT